MEYPDEIKQVNVTDTKTVPVELDKYLKSFKIDWEKQHGTINGLFGYTSYDAVQYFETIKFKSPVIKDHKIPEMRYCFYKF